MDKNTGKHLTQAQEKEVHQLAEDIQKNIGTALFTSAYGEIEKAFQNLKQDAKKLEDNPELKQPVRNELATMHHENKNLPKVSIDAHDDKSLYHNDETITVTHDIYAQHPTSYDADGSYHAMLKDEHISLNVGPKSAEMKKEDITGYRDGPGL